MKHARRAPEIVEGKLKSHLDVGKEQLEKEQLELEAKDLIEFTRIYYGRRAVSVQEVVHFADEESAKSPDLSSAISIGLLEPKELAELKRITEQGANLPDEPYSGFPGEPYPL